MDKQASDKQMLQFSIFPQFIVANAAYNLTWLRALANEKEQDNEMGLGINKLWLYQGCQYKVDNL